MAQQFLFQYTNDTFENEQILPDVFAEYFKNESNMPYLNGTDRYRYKTELQNRDGKWVLCDKEWSEFVVANVPRIATTMHFVRVGEDDYYVTMYDISGSECAGYDRRKIRPRMTRCLATYAPGITLLPGDFLQDIWQNNFTLIYAGMSFHVRHKRVKPWEDRIVRMNGLTGYGWDDFVVTAVIQWGQQLVFTNLERYTLSVVVIGGYDGLGLSREDIRTTLLKRPPRPILYRYRNDPRMHHICTWYHHNAHVNEDMVVYTRFRLEVGYYYPLTIESKIWDDLNLHKYRKAKILHMKWSYSVKLQPVLHTDNPFKIKALVMAGNWNQFGQECGFEQQKMIRIKLVRYEVQSDKGQLQRVPIFHVCQYSITLYQLMTPQPN